MLNLYIPVAGDPGRCPVVPTGIIIESVAETCNVAPVVGVPVPKPTLPVEPSTNKALASLSDSILTSTSALASLTTISCPATPSIISLPDPDEIVFPSTEILSTVRAVVVTVVPSNVKLALSWISPPVPA